MSNFIKIHSAALRLLHAARQTDRHVKGNGHIASVPKVSDTDEVIEQSAYLESFHCRLSYKMKHKYTGIPQFWKVIQSMKTVHKVRIRTLKIKLPCTLHVKVTEFMNGSFLL
jgi:hypothetical protein